MTLFRLPWTVLADRKLRSAQAAFELLDSFAGSGVTARGAVAGAMLNKEADILAQFAHEVRRRLVLMANPASKTPFCSPFLGC